jgi:hypothetical protein
MPKKIAIIGILLIVTIATVESVWLAFTFLVPEPEPQKIMREYAEAELNARKTIFNLSAISDVNNLSVGVKLYYLQNQQIPKTLQEVIPFLEDKTSIQERMKSFSYQYLPDEVRGIYKICAGLLWDIKENQREYCQTGIFED